MTYSSLNILSAKVCTQITGALKKNEWATLPILNEHHVGDVDVSGRVAEMQQFADYPFCANFAILFH